MTHIVSIFCFNLVHFVKYLTKEFMHLGQYGEQGLLSSHFFTYNFIESKKSK